MCDCFRCSNGKRPLLGKHPGNMNQDDEKWWPGVVVSASAEVKEAESMEMSKDEGIGVKWYADCQASQVSSL